MLDSSISHQLTLSSLNGFQDLSEVDNKPFKTESTASKADEEKMSEILSDPATLDVLKDPWISKLIKNLKENPTEARRLVSYY